MNIIHIDPQQLYNELLANNELAVIDIREAKYYAQGHINLSAHIALSQLEITALHTLPRKSVPLVIVAETEHDSLHAAGKLSHLGYQYIRILAGGINAWVAAGYPTGTGYNTLVKTFSDLVHRHYRTPTITVAELQHRLLSEQPTTIIDCRPEYEYRNLSLPGAHNIPGTELALHHLKPREDNHLYVISCFSRTRGIIGTTTLAHLSHQTNVAFLEDGIMAAFLYGIATAPGHAESEFPAHLLTDSQLKQQSDKIIADYDLQQIDINQYQRLLDEREERTLYVFDIRPQAAYQQAHLPEAISVPGGQLLMNFDLHVPVRHARIVLIDDPHSQRAAVSAFWLSHFNHAEIYLLPVDHTQLTAASDPETLSVLPQNIRWLTPHQAASQLQQGITLFDVGPSLFYEKQHIAGAHFILRSALSRYAKEHGLPPRILFTSPDAENAAYAAAEVEREFAIETWVLQGGTDAWRNAGFPVTDQFSAAQLLSPFDDDWGSTMRAKTDREQKFRHYLSWERSLGQLIPQDSTVQFTWPEITKI